MPMSASPACVLTKNSASKTAEAVTLCFGLVPVACSTATAGALDKAPPAGAKRGACILV